jgi:hypothetical protein
VSTPATPAGCARETHLPQFELDNALIFCKVFHASPDLPSIADSWKTLLSSSTLDFIQFRNVHVRFLLVDLKGIIFKFIAFYKRELLFNCIETFRALARK